MGWPNAQLTGSVAQFPMGTPPDMPRAPGKVELSNEPNGLRGLASCHSRLT
jgi:hypothetical protein